MSSRPRSAPFSTHTRGVPLFDRGRFLDIPRHATTGLLDLRDIGSSAFWFLSLQSWLTFWSVLINIVSVIFFCYYKHSEKRLAVPLDFTLLAFTVILPLVGFVWIAYQRRDRCLDLLSEAKCLMISIVTAHAQWLSGSQSTSLPLTQAAIANLCAAMRAYFLPSRFYSRNYPYLGYKSAMIQIALDRARCQRQIRMNIEALGVATTTARAAGLLPSLEALLHERCLRLSTVIDKLGNVKEFGTPQGIRSLARFYICLVIPLFFAPYWAWVAAYTNFSLAFFISIVIQVSMTGLMNVAMALEDPFDNNGMDGIFIEESIFDVEATLLSTGADPGVLLEGEGVSSKAGGVDGSGGGGGGGGAAVGEESKVVRVATDAV